MTLRGAPPGIELGAWLLRRVRATDPLAGLVVRGAPCLGIVAFLRLPGCRCASHSPDGRAKEDPGGVFSAPDLGCRRDGCRGLVNRPRSLAEGGEVGLAEHASQVPGRMDDEADLIPTAGALGDALPGPLRERDLLRLYGAEGLPAAEDRGGPLDPGRQTTGVGSHKHLGSAHPAAKAPDTPPDPPPPPFPCAPSRSGRPKRKTPRSRFSSGNPGRPCPPEPPLMGFPGSRCEPRNVFPMYSDTSRLSIGTYDPLVKTVGLDLG